VGPAGGAQQVRPTAASATPDAGADRPQLPDPGWSATWTPTRPAAPPRAQPDVSVVAAPALRHDEVPPVVVRRGDTLWAIAERHLGPGASAADIAEQWPRWWQANRARIGDDPNRLLPGQVLVAPTVSSTR
jgi:nucleoid-associated protein YgaU